MNAPQLFNFVAASQEITFFCADKKVNLDQECVGIPAFSKVVEKCHAPEEKTLLEFLECYCPLLSALKPKVIECVLKQCESITQKEIEETFESVYQENGCEEVTLNKNIDSETNSFTASSTDSSTVATDIPSAPTTNGAKTFGVLSLFGMFLIC
jgi:hypothetical protein